jgi:chloramphenicol O-acetyltransferase type B
MIRAIIKLLKQIKRFINSKFLKVKINVFTNNQVGDNNLFGRRVNLGGHVIVGSHGYIGQYSYIGPNTHIGDFCIFADNVNIIGADHEFQNPHSPIILSGTPKEQPTTIIGDDVWLGHGVVIMRGIKIGDGAIVGANAVVTQDVDARSIYAGVPAKKLRDRFDTSVNCEIHKNMIKTFKSKSVKLANSKFIN